MEECSNNELLVGPSGFEIKVPLFIHGDIRIVGTRIPNLSKLNLDGLVGALKVSGLGIPS